MTVRRVTATVTHHLSASSAATSPTATLARLETRDCLVSVAASLITM